MIRIIMADDHPIIVDGLLRWMKEESDLEVIVTANSLDEATPLIEQHQPDVVVLDFRMPGMSGASSIIPLAQAGHRVIIFSFLDESALIQSIEQAGAMAFVSKHEPVARLVEVIRLVHQGQACFPDIDAVPVPHEHLSQRERLVFDLLILGHTPKEIAYEVDIAVSSVYTYSERVRRKIGVDSTQALIQYAYNVGLLQT